MTTIEQRPVDRRTSNTARIVNVVLGVWLFISAWIWPHTETSRANTWICGLLVMAIALVALRIRPMRWLNAAIGAWVVIAGFLFPHIAAGTMLNNIIVGLLVLLVSVGGISRPPPLSPMP